MKESEFNVTKHCNHCKKNLIDHPKDLINGEYVIIRYADKCPFSEVEFD